MNRAVAICLAAGLWVLPVALSAGCGGDDDDSGHNDDHDGGGDHHGHEDVGPDSGAKCPDGGTKLTYGNFAEPFFKSYCLRCHSKSVTGDKRMGAPSDHNFDTLAEIELLAMHIDQKAAAGPDSTNEAMPPSNPKPSTDDRKKLGEWLACDLPE